MTTLQRTADLPEFMRVDIVPLDAEIAALETLQQGLDETMRRLIGDEIHHRTQRDRLNATEPEPKTLDFLYGGDWHAAHAAWECLAIERKEKLVEVTEAHDRAWRTYVEFAEWVIKPAKERLEQLRAKRAEIFDARMSLCEAGMKAAWKGGMGLRPAA